MCKTNTMTDNPNLMQAAGTARGTKASTRRQPHILLWMVLLIGWIFSGATASAQVPGAPYVPNPYFYKSPKPNGIDYIYGFNVNWIAPLSSGGSEITEYKISAKVSPTAANKNATAKLLGEVTTEFTGIVSTARTKLIVLSSLNNFDPNLNNIYDSFTCTVSVYAKNASGYSSAGSAGSVAWIHNHASIEYAGSAVAGFRDEQGRNALFNGISGLTVDSTNTFLYISDRGNHSIRKMSMDTYAVSTLAGPAPRPDVDADSAPTGGFADTNSGATAQFNFPGDLEIAYTGRYSNAGAGMLIVTDTWNHRIRAVDLSTGATTTIAGGGSAGYGGDGGAATAAFLSFPSGVAVDSNGNIYIADTGNRVIRKINSSDGIIHTIAGGTDNHANTAGFDVNYLDDSDEAQVARVYYAGNGVPVTSTTLSAPTKLSIDINNDIYFTDSGNKLIRRIDATTQMITTVAGVPPVTDPNNSKPTVDTDGYLISGVSSGDGGLATAATLRSPEALYVLKGRKLLMFLESGNKLRYVNDVILGNGRIASDDSITRWYYSTLSAIALNNRGGIATVHYIADAYSIYRVVPIVEMLLNYSLAPIPVLSFATPTSASMRVGTTFANVATSSISVVGSGAITYKSSAPSIATVNGSTGLVTGVATGTVTITATQAANATPATRAFINDSASQTYTLTVTAMVPSVASPTSTSLGLTSATLGGTVASTGGVTLSARGVVYSRTADNSSPTIGGTGVTKMVAGTTTTGAFTIGATGLSQGTAYSFAAYATNSVGTAYTSVGTFTTTLPTPTLSFATATPASIAVGATLSNASTSSLSGAGNGAISYSSSNVSIATVDVATGVVTGVGAGTATITATQAAAAGFNNQATQTYTLTVTAMVPSVASPTSTTLGLTSATLGGTVASTGGVTLSARGVVYSRTADNSSPTIGGTGVTNMVEGTTATGAFTIGATGLSQGTAYSFAAYATNSVGTAYTSVGTFTTAMDFTYTDNGAVVTITGYTGAGGAVTIPGSIGGLPVIEIGDLAFSPDYQGIQSITSVTIPNSVTSIGNYAFNGCSGLTSVTIPNSVTSFGGGAFNGCTGLTSVTIPNRMTSIGNGAFSGCSGLTSVTIPNSVTSIGNGTFSGCSDLTSVTFPNSVTSIGDQAFACCTGLTSLTIPDSVTSIGNQAFSDCSGLNSVAIPNSVTSISNGAFSGCSGLTSVTIPNSVTSIGEYAFQGCRNLTSVTIPASVTNIGGVAFADCNGLTSVTIPNSVTSIADSTFQNCTGLTSVTIPNSVTSIGSYAFYGCSGLTSVTIPSSVTSIGTSAFYQSTSLNKIQFEGNAPAISSGAFSSLSADAKIFVHASATGFAASYDGVLVVVVLPTPPPMIKSALLYAGQFVIQVDGSTTGILLEQSADLQAWSRVTNAVITGDSFAIPTNGASKAFYRLGRQ